MILKVKHVLLWGNGKRMKFWKDICCGDLALRISFYSSFTIAISKDAWVVDMWDELGEGGIGAPVSQDISSLRAENF